MYRKKSFYDVLGVTQSATKEEIKSKYREMAKKCHPDLNQDDKNAEKKFREITEAYEVLESDSKRQQYDAYGGQGTDVSLRDMSFVKLYLKLQRATEPYLSWHSDSKSGNYSISGRDGCFCFEVNYDTMHMQDKRKIWEQ